MQRYHKKLDIRIYSRMSMFFSGADETQRFDDGDDGDDDSGGYGGDGNRDHGSIAADRSIEPFHAIPCETIAVIDAPQLFWRGRVQVFKKRIQDDNGGQQPIYDLQGQQGEPEKTGKIIGKKGEKSHQDLSHRPG